MEINSLLFFFFVLQKALRCFPICFKICLSFTGYSFSGSAWWTFDYVIGPSRKRFTFALGLGALHALPQVTQLLFGLQFDGESQADHCYFLLFWPPARLSAIYAWWAWWYQSQSWVSSFLDFLLWGKKYLHQPFFLFLNKFALIILNTRSPIIILFHGCELPSFFSSLCGLLRCGDTGCHLCLPPALLPSLGSLLSSLWVCFLSLPIHIPASLFFILQLKLLLQRARKLFWCSACCGNKLSLTPSYTACILLMQYVVCVCMRFWYKKGLWTPEETRQMFQKQRCFRREFILQFTSVLFNSVTSWRPTVCADYIDVSKAYILCSSLHVRINKDTWE